MVFMMFVMTFVLLVMFVLAVTTGGNAVVVVVVIIVFAAAVAAVSVDAGRLDTSCGKNFRWRKLGRRSLRRRFYC